MSCFSCFSINWRTRLMANTARIYTLWALCQRVYCLCGFTDWNITYTKLYLRYVMKQIWWWYWHSLNEGIYKRKWKVVYKEREFSHELIFYKETKKLLKLEKSLHTKFKQIYNNSFYCLLSIFSLSISRYNMFIYISTSAHLQYSINIWQASWCP